MQFPSDVTDSRLKSLYGITTAVTTSGLKRSMWALLSQSGETNLSGDQFGSSIDLKEFFEQTSPIYFLYYCRMNEVNCIKHSGEEVIWEKVPVNILSLSLGPSRYLRVFIGYQIGTMNGICLTFKPQDAIPKLINKSKNTNGYVRPRGCSFSISIVCIYLVSI